MRYPEYVITQRSSLTMLEQSECCRKLLWLIDYILTDCCCSVAKSCPTLWPHGLQHKRLPCPSLLPKFAQILVHWVDDGIQSSHPLLPTSPLAFNLSQYQGLFQWVGSSHQVAKVLELHFQEAFNEYSEWISFRINWLGLLAAQGTLKSLLQHHNLKASFGTQPPLCSKAHVCMTTGKTIVLTIQTFVGKLMSLLFNMLSIAFLPKASVLISWLHSSPAVILEPKKIKSVTVSILSPSICPWSVGTGWIILVFWMLSFKPAFSLSYFTFIKRLFSSSLLSAIRMVSAYLWLLVFLSAILIPACISSSPGFHMRYFAYKLNNQSDKNTALTCSVPNFEPVYFSMSGSYSCLLTCMQVSQEERKVVWYFQLFKNFPQFLVIHAVKDFT